MSRELLISGQLYGKIAGLSRNKDWVLFYLEVSSTQLHIFEGHDDLTVARKHLRSLEIDMMDMVVPERDKRTYRFTLKRADGNYTFKCDSEEMRQKWIAAMERLINKRHFQRMPGFQSPTASTFDPSQVGKKSDEPKRVDVPQVPSNRAFTAPGRSKQSAVDQPLPPVPGSGDSSSSPGSSGSGSFSVDRNAQRFSKMSVKSDDSGLGPSVEGHVRHSHSGDGTNRRVPVKTTNQTSVSDSAKFEAREELENYPWFWGHMDRPTSEKKMKEVGKVGNFSIRINAKGEYVMTFWRKDSVHHHKIIHQCGIYRFERTAVSAEGSSLVDLLDNYMKNCTDKKIIPFGGQLHLVYDEAWNPPDIDMEVLQEKLREKRRREDRQRLMDSMNLVQPQHNKKKKKQERKEEYTVVSGSSDSQEEQFTQSMPASGFRQQEQEPRFHVQASPSEKRNGLLSSSKQASEQELCVPKKPLPPTPSAKPQGSGAKHKPLPVPPTKQRASPSHSPQPQRAEVDRRNNPLPPVPDAPSTDQPASDGGRSPRVKKGPVPTPTPRKHMNKSPTSPTPIVQDQSSSSPVSHSPPPEQSVYMNTNFGRSRAKKSPVAQPHSPSLSPPLPADTKPGPESYQNVGFGDSGGDGAIYANVVGPRVSARKGTGEKAGRARVGRREGDAQLHSQQQQVDGSVHQAVPYQNVAFNGQNLAGTEYQNVSYSHGANTRNMGTR